MVFGSVCLDVKAGEEGLGAARKDRHDYRQVDFFPVFFFYKIEACFYI